MLQGSHKTVYIGCFLYNTVYFWWPEFAYVQRHNFLYTHRFVQWRREKIYCRLIKFKIYFVHIVLQILAIFGKKFKYCPSLYVVVVNIEDVATEPHDFKQK